MDRLETDLINACVIIQMLENQKHIWSNRLAQAGDEKDRVELVLDSIEMMIERKGDEITHLAGFITRPL